MPTRCDHDPDEKYLDKRGSSACHACDRIRNRRSRGTPDLDPKPKKPGSPSRLDPNATVKVCNRCQQVKPVEEFYKAQGNADGLQRICKGCRKNYYDYAQHRELYLRRKYGISVAEYESLLDKQKGVCFICKASPDTMYRKILAVDHDHESGRIRGLLCNHCNQGLGHFRDSPELLEAALAYIKIL